MRTVPPVQSIADAVPVVCAEIATCSAGSAYLELGDLCNPSSLLDTMSNTLNTPRHSAENCSCDEFDRPIRIEKTVSKKTTALRVFLRRSRGTPRVVSPLQFLEFSSWMLILRHRSETGSPGRLE